VGNGKTGVGKASNHLEIKGPMLTIENAGASVNP
jgi:hypothetical protein